MLEIFFILLAAVVFGGILLKFWRYILAIIILVIYFVISIPLYILIELSTILCMACMSEEELEEKIVRSYDKMLHEASSKEELARCRKTIKRIQVILQHRKETQNDKHLEDMLEEAK